MQRIINLYVKKHKIWIIILKIKKAQHPTEQEIMHEKSKNSKEYISNLLRN